MSYITNPLAWLVAILVAFSAYCEITLFISFAGDDTGNQWLMAIMAGGMVAGQFLLVNEAVNKLSDGHKWLAGAAGLSAAALLGVSVTGTSTFFETQYQKTLTTEKTSSSDYQDLTDSINSKLTSEKHFRDLAKKEEAKGNEWIAGQHLKKADAAADAVIRLKTQRRNLPQQQAGSATVLGSEFGEQRKIAWWFFGMVADFLPALAIVLLKTPNSKTTTDKTAETVKTDAEQLEKQPLLTAVEDPQQTENSKENQPFSTVRHAIEVLGYMPSWSQLKQKGFTYTQYKRQRDELITAGIVRQNGQSYELVQEQTA